MSWANKHITNSISINLHAADVTEILQVPRLTTAQRENPGYQREGGLVYDIDLNGFLLFVNGAWQTIETPPVTMTNIGEGADVNAQRDGPEFQRQRDC